MNGRSDRPRKLPIDRTEAALAVGYLAVLVAIGALIALALGRSPGSFLADLLPIRSGCSGPSSDCSSS